MLYTVFTGNSFGIQDGSNAAHYVHQALRGDVAFAACTMVHQATRRQYTHSVINTHTRQPIHSLGHRYTHSTICHTRIHTGSLAYSLAYSLTHSLIHSSTRTNSLYPSCNYARSMFRLLSMYPLCQCIRCVNVLLCHCIRCVNVSVAPMYPLCHCANVSVVPMYPLCHCVNVSVVSIYPL